MRIIVTFTHNKSTYSDFWDNYYRPFFDEVRYIDADSALRNDWGATYHIMNSIQEELFKTYDKVVFTDIDEILVADPDKYKDFGAFLDKAGNTRATGYNIIDNGTKLDLSKPILKQRENWSYDPLYNKYVILTSPQVYASNHSLVKGFEPNPDLVLMHLRDADVSSAKERLEALGRTFNTRDFEQRRFISKLIPDKWRVI